ncbi:PREDICTED: probable CCR4-associated factor 1 homolog 9 [Erythranthe guttata]|uniref:probable CCR4-associated factor 1 homolog 9 n=1 Tax=Erythranthe guttata TaxID=4155 RepID=UPI00064DAF54|nr:PREDICTED: probable CCR4-associated factor 1 homolog 9 [Erythranthe guttata]|eukprot:XP_012839750.1 PREDICTED: probable CCR4-associated factor 1 homolog 9 [Erythranthe guttata]
MSSSSSSHVHVCHVWAANLEEEFRHIDKCLHPNCRQFTFVSMDTEFPGTIYNPEGVRESTPFGGTGLEQIWEFNFQFDSAVDPHNKESVSLLEKQGIDLSRNKKYGIDPREFAMQFKCSELGRRSYYGRVVWITFHGLYDFAYLTKILNGGELLPDDLDEFMRHVWKYFKGNVYDLKSMIPFVGLHGGLEKVARSLNVKRVVGKRHQAGSDSLLTMHAFFGLMRSCLEKGGCDPRGVNLMVAGRTGLEMMQTLFGLFGLMKRNSCSGSDGLLMMQTLFGLDARPVF